MRACVHLLNRRRMYQFFLDLWQDLRDISAIDERTRVTSGKVLDLDRSGSNNSTLFDGLADSFAKLSKRVDGLIVRHVSREVTSELEAYVAKRWDFKETSTDDDDGDDEELSLSPELPGPLSLYSTLLSSLRDTLPPVLVVPLYREIAGSIERFLVDRVAVARTFSERGGKQFRFDVVYGWMEAAREGGGLRRPENGMRKLLDAGALLALPAGQTGQHGGGGGGVKEEDTGPSFATVMRLAWDDDGTRELAEVLQRMGVLAMTRDEVKRVLRRRPECWR
jgi:hypothetical protein